MTAVLLQRALCDKLRHITEHFMLNVPKSGVCAPHVHAGYLPQQQSGSENVSDFPYIIVRILDGQDQDESIVRIKLLFGIFSRDDNGFVDVLNLMEKVRQSLLKDRVVDNRYRLELPYKWKLFEDQPYPEWIGEADTTWMIPTILEEDAANREEFI
ncbi:hypothetical protein ACHHV8_33520 [Paenibacillus sp. TAB 01]|uniref:hypothetical protein n=1 Tax=Paenibacillus sp. TAB 01 TaxID=3368988 RepID=UPI003750AE37